MAGKYDPTDAEKVAKIEDDEMAEIRKNLKMEYPENVKGVPDFWLTIFRRAELLSPMIQEINEPVLIDIKIVYSIMSYTLEFHIEPNKCFTNTVLQNSITWSLQWTVTHHSVSRDPRYTKGWVFHWNKNKNLIDIKQVPTDSFFKFFNPPRVFEDEAAKRWFNSKHLIEEYAY